MIFDRRIMAQPHAEVDLNTAAIWWLAKYGITDPSCFRDPLLTHRMEEEYHTYLGLEWSYDGYLKDRSTIRRGTYVEKEGLWMHLGVDLNVNPCVKIYAVAGGPIVFQGSDYPLVGGWGYHLIQLIEYHGEKHALMYAHLSRESYIPARNHAKKGDRLGSVGKTHHNGGWRPHVHVQLFADIGEVRDWEKFSKDVDGYAKPEEYDYWALKCPDPTDLVFGT